VRCRTHFLRGNNPVRPRTDLIIEHEAISELFNATVEMANKRGLLSGEHFSVDGTLILAWASHKSMRCKDGSDDGLPPENWRGEPRSNDAHESTTDPESRLYRCASSIADGSPGYIHQRFQSARGNERMAAVNVDMSRVHEFVDAASFERWLVQHHASEPEVWIKLHKVGSDLPSITAKEAIDMALCWGWIDAIRKSFDGQSFLQRYTPRGKCSVWSQVNVDNVARLVAAGRMTVHGLAHVQAAKADGRWARAYVAGLAFPIPEDLQTAIDAEPQARAMLATLSAQNRFALAFRVHNMKTDAGRRRKIESFVAMLKRGETIYPQGRK
jgi:uncharacterized protein YdeI (YjbR/CyaY-like superfamily)